MVFSILQHHWISDQHGKRASAATHISAEIKVADQLVSAGCAASRFVDDSASSGDCGAGPAGHRKIYCHSAVGVVLCHRWRAGVAAGSVARAADLVGNVVAAVVCFVGGVG